MPDRVLSQVTAACAACSRQASFTFTHWPGVDGRHRQIAVGEMPSGLKAVISGPTGSTLHVVCSCGGAVWRSDEPAPRRDPETGSPSGPELGFALGD